MATVVDECAAEDCSVWLGGKDWVARCCPDVSMEWLTLFEENRTELQQQLSSIGWRQVLAQVSQTGDMPVVEDTSKKVVTDWMPRWGRRYSWM